MSEPTKAVFLSYARDDAAAARRIAEALRASGLEVWFDESELRGGDQWDQKIRGQIKACALFIPIISATTQTRDEGYFRLEWKLADDRSHLMAPGKAFIVPVVIDETPEAGAEVPDSYSRAQWSRLPGGLPTPQFVGQVSLLLQTPKKPALKPSLPRPPTLPPEFRATAKTQKTEDRGQGTAGRKSVAPRWTWGAVTAIVVGIATAVYSGRKSESPVVSAVLPPSPSLSPSPPAPAAPVAAPGKSIAVLPFANFSQDKDNEFFADGLQDEVITALSKIHDLKVISRTSVLAYKNPEGRNLKKIANELGVTTILEGSVQRAGNQVHLNVQLIDARTDEHLWAETYTKELTDIFTLETALAREIAGALKANLTDGEQQLLARRPTQNTEAYELYLRALVLDQKLAIFNNPADYEAALALYAQAAAKDPAFALPHAHASILHGTMYWFAALDATPERSAKALAELEAARRLAPDAPETRMAEGVFEYTCHNDWSRALEHFHAAEADLPNDARLHFHTGLAYRRLGRLPEALAQFEQAVVLNPADNNTDTTLVETCYCLRRYPRVLELCTRYLELFPGDVKLSRFRVFARFELDGDHAAFLRALPALPQPADISSARSLAYHDAMLTGDLAGAERILTDNHLEKVLNIDGTINDPVALHRAMLAFLRGNAEEARRRADEAIAAYRQGHWVYRQEPWVQLGIARANVYAGRVEDGLRLGRAAVDDENKRDGFSVLAFRIEYGRMLILAHRPDEALAELREMAARPSVVLARNVLREDVIWSRLKSDPRFEEILGSFKPL